MRGHKQPDWQRRAISFFAALIDPENAVYPSVTSGPITLYGTCYTLLARYYLGVDDGVANRTRSFIQGCQDPQTGLMIGPELQDFKPAPGAMHDREHLILHSTCTAVPVCRHFGIPLRYPVIDARRFCDVSFLRDWLDRRNWKQAWFEGNNILFVGQLLVYLRDAERRPEAGAALNYWFEWLDSELDPATSLWGTNGCCSAAQAVYGGYHQLLVYHYEDRPICNSRGLVDTVLGLQHGDGGFNPSGNGGACEDVDAVDILVNRYKRHDYRRAEIRLALRRCLRHILGLQNEDGGFPYNRGCPQTHMGIPGTSAPPNVSTTFATWFRVHTLALMAEILTDESELQIRSRFTNNLSMGWHSTWAGQEHKLTRIERASEIAPFLAGHCRQRARQSKMSVLRVMKALPGLRAFSNRRRRKTSR